MKHAKGNGNFGQRWIALFMLSAAIYLVAAYVGFFVPGADPGFVSILVSMATAMVAIGLVRAWQESRGEVAADERTKLVQRIAVGYSWWFAYVLIAVLLLVDYFRLASLTADGALSLVFFGMIASLIVSRFYLSRKGGLE